MSIEQEECTRALPKALARRGHAFRSDDVEGVWRDRCAWCNVARKDVQATICLCGVADPPTHDIGDGLQRCVNCGSH